MALAPGVEYLLHHLESGVESLVLEDGEHSPELLGREAMLFTDLALGNDQERLVGGYRKPGALRDGARGPRDRLRCPPPFGVPIGGLEQLLLLLVHQMAALSLELRQERVVD